LINFFVDFDCFIDSLLKEEIVDEDQFIYKIMGFLLNEVLNEVDVLFLELDVLYVASIL